MGFPHPGRRLRLLILAASLVLFTLGSFPPQLAYAATKTPTPLPFPTAFSTPTSTQLPVLISFPLAGQMISGLVRITGTSAAGDFARYEVAFGYPGDPTATWFDIQAGENPVSAGTLALWDTTSITDGVYTLRLRIFVKDGSFSDIIVPGVVVNNYTPTDTPTPTATLPPTWTPAPVIPTSTPTTTSTPYPTPTALPANPAAVSQQELLKTTGWGAALVTLVIVMALSLGAFRPRRW